MRERQPRPGIARHLRLAAGRRQGDLGDGLAHALEAQQPPGEQEDVARRQPVDEHLLDLAQHLAAALEPDPQHRRLDDGADVHPVARAQAPVGQPPEPVLALPQPPVALVDAERVAAGRDELEHVRRSRARDRSAIGCARAHLLVELVGLERPAAGDADEVLGEHVEPARVRRPPSSVCSRIASRGAALQHLEAVAGHQQRARRLVEAVVGAADPLQEP